MPLISLHDMPNISHHLLKCEAKCFDSSLLLPALNVYEPDPSLFSESTVKCHASTFYYYAFCYQALSFMFPTFSLEMLGSPFYSIAQSITYFLSYSEIYSCSDVLGVYSFVEFSLRKLWCFVHQFSETLSQTEWEFIFKLVIAICIGADGYVRCSEPMLRTIIDPHLLLFQ